MSSGAANLGSLDLEALLEETLRPIEPPERLSARVESTLSKLSDAASAELAEWAEELTESELESLRDPRNWVRPVAAAAVGGVAGVGLVALEIRRRSKAGESIDVIGEVRRRFS